MTTLARPRTTSQHKSWSIDEESLLLDTLRSGPITYPQLQSRFPDRSLVSVRNKVRKLRIKHDLFGDSYREDKVSFTNGVAARVQPRVVFEAYAGSGHQTMEWLQYAHRIYAADRDESKIRQLHDRLKANGFQREKGSGPIRATYRRGNYRVSTFVSDAVQAAAWVAANGHAVDLVDLDTCGTTLPTLASFIGILQPSHLVITHGEFHSLRFGREDVIRKILVHRAVDDARMPESSLELAKELDKAVRTFCLLSSNESHQAWWPSLEAETWLGPKNTGILRRHYQLGRPPASADCLNWLSAESAGPAQGTL